MAAPTVPVKVRALMGSRRHNVLEGMRHLLKSQQVEKPAWYDVMEKYPAPPTATPFVSRSALRPETMAELQRIYALRRPLDAFPAFRFLAPFQQALRAELPPLPASIARLQACGDPAYPAAKLAWEARAAARAASGLPLVVIRQALEGRLRSALPRSPQEALMSLLDERDALLTQLFASAGVGTLPSAGEQLRAARPSLPVQEEAEFWVQEPTGETGVSALEAATGGKPRVIRRMFLLDVASDGLSLQIKTPGGTLVYDESAARAMLGMPPLLSVSEAWEEEEAAAWARKNSPSEDDLDEDVRVDHRAHVFD